MFLPYMAILRKMFIWSIFFQVLKYKNNDNNNNDNNFAIASLQMVL